MELVNLKRRRKSKETPTKGKVGKLYLQQVIGLSCNTSNGVAFHPMDTSVAYTAGTSVIIYNTDVREQSHVLRATGKNRAFGPVVFETKGDHIAAGEKGSNGAIQIWQLNSGRCIQTLKAHKNGSTHLCFAANGKYLASAGATSDDHVCVWDWQAGILLCKQLSQIQVMGLTFTADSSALITGGREHFKVWTLSPSTVASRSRAGCTSTTALTLTPRLANLKDLKRRTFVGLSPGPGGPAGDGVYALTSCGVLILMKPSGRDLDKHTDLGVLRAHGFAVSQSRVACACSQGVVRVVSTSTLVYQGTLPKVAVRQEQKARALGGLRPDGVPQYPDALSCAFSQDGNVLTVAYADQTLVLWGLHDMPKVVRLKTICSHEGCVWACAAMPSGQEMQDSRVVTCGSDGTLRLWTLRSAEEGRIAMTSGCQREAQALPGIICTTVTPTVDANQGAVPKGPVAEPPGYRREPINRLHCLSVSPELNHIAVGDHRGNIRVYDLASHALVALKEAHEGEVRTVAYGPVLGGGEVYLASSGRDTLIHIYKVSADYEVVCTLDEHSSSVTAVCFDFSGQRLISCSGDKSLVVRKLCIDEGAVHCELLHRQQLAKPLYDMAVCKATLVTVGQDCVMRVWDLESLTLVRSIPSEANAGEPGRVILDPSGTFVATACSDGVIRMYRLADGQLMAKAAGHGDMATSALITADCRVLVSLGGDGCTCVWQIPAALRETMQVALAQQEADQKSRECDEEPQPPPLESIDKSPEQRIRAAWPTHHWQTMSSTILRVQQGKPMVSAEKLPKWARVPALADPPPPGEEDSANTPEDPGIPAEPEEPSGGRQRSARVSEDVTVYDEKGLPTTFQGAGGKRLRVDDDEDLEERVAPEVPEEDEVDEHDSGSSTGAGCSEVPDKAVCAPQVKGIAKGDDDDLVVYGALSDDEPTAFQVVGSTDTEDPQQELGAQMSAPVTDGAGGPSLRPQEGCDEAAEAVEQVVSLRKDLFKEHFWTLDQGSLDGKHEDERRQSFTAKFLRERSNLLTFEQATGKTSAVTSREFPTFGAPQCQQPVHSPDDGPPKCSAGSASKAARSNHSSKPLLVDTQDVQDETTGFATPAGSNETRTWRTGKMNTELQRMQARLESLQKAYDQQQRRVTPWKTRGRSYGDGKKAGPKNSNRRVSEPETPEGSSLLRSSADGPGQKGADSVASDPGVTTRFEAEDGVFVGGGYGATVRTSCALSVLSSPSSSVHLEVQDVPADGLEDDAEWVSAEKVILTLNNDHNMGGAHNVNTRDTSSEDPRQAQPNLTPPLPPGPPPLTSMTRLPSQHEFSGRVKTAEVPQAETAEVNAITGGSPKGGTGQALGASPSQSSTVVEGCHTPDSIRSPMAITPDPTGTTSSPPCWHHNYAAAAVADSGGSQPRGIAVGPPAADPGRFIHNPMFNLTPDMGYKPCGQRSPWDTGSEDQGPTVEPMDQGTPLGLSRFSQDCQVQMPADGVGLVNSVDTVDSWDHMTGPDRRLRVNNPLIESKHGNALSGESAPHIQEKVPAGKEKADVPFPTHMPATISEGVVQAQGTIISESPGAKSRAAKLSLLRRPKSHQYPELTKVTGCRPCGVLSTDDSIQVDVSSMPGQQHQDSEDVTEEPKAEVNELCACPEEDPAPSGPPDDQPSSSPQSLPNNNSVAAVPVIDQDTLELRTSSTNDGKQLNIEEACLPDQAGRETGEKQNSGGHNGDSGITPQAPGIFQADNTAVGEAPDEVTEPVSEEGVHVVLTEQITASHTEVQPLMPEATPEATTPQKTPTTGGKGGSPGMMGLLQRMKLRLPSIARKTSAGKNTQRRLSEKLNSPLEPPLPLKAEGDCLIPAEKSAEGSQPQLKMDTGTGHPQGTQASEDGPDTIPVNSMTAVAPGTLAGGDASGSLAQQCGTGIQQQAPEVLSPSELQPSCGSTLLPALAQQSTCDTETEVGQPAAAPPTLCESHEDVDGMTFTDEHVAHVGVARYGSLDRETQGGGDSQDTNGCGMTSHTGENPAGALNRIGDVGSSQDESKAAGRASAGLAAESMTKGTDEGFLSTSSKVMTYQQQQIYCEDSILVDEGREEPAVREGHHLGQGANQTAPISSQLPRPLNDYMAALKRFEAITGEMRLMCRELSVARMSCDNLTFDHILPPEPAASPFRNHQPSKAAEPALGPTGQPEVIDPSSIVSDITDQFLYGIRASTEELMREFSCLPATNPPPEGFRIPQAQHNHHNFCAGRPMPQHAVTPTGSPRQEGALLSPCPGGFSPAVRMLHPWGWPDTSPALHPRSRSVATDLTSASIEDVAEKICQKYSDILTKKLEEKLMNKLMHGMGTVPAQDEELRGAGSSTPH